MYFSRLRKPKKKKKKSREEKRSFKLRAKAWSRRKYISKKKKTLYNSQVKSEVLFLFEEVVEDKLSDKVRI